MGNAVSFEMSLITRKTVGGGKGFLGGSYDGFLRAIYINPYEGTLDDVTLSPLPRRATGFEILGYL